MPIHDGDMISWQRSNQTRRTGTVMTVIRRGRKTIGYRVVDNRTGFPVVLLRYQVRRT